MLARFDRFLRKLLSEMLRGAAISGAAMHGIYYNPNPED